MCDQECYGSCTTSFYHQYMNQHAVMTQFIRQLNQNTNAVSLCNTCQTCQCDFYNPMNTHHRPFSHECSSSSSECCSCESSSTNTSSEYEVEQEDSYENDDGDDESECEFEFNVEAILAMRAAKEELNKSSKSPTNESESIVLVDSDKEDFEFIELGSYKTLASKLSRSIGSDVNKNEEFENQKKIMDYLYGEKSATIGGLETAMAVNFEHLCDVHQPSLWPVLPVRL